MFSVPNKANPDILYAPIRLTLEPMELKQLFEEEKEDDVDYYDFTCLSDIDEYEGPIDP